MSNCKYCEKEMKSGDKVAIMHKDCFNKITDLETKLAEKDEELEEVKQHRTQILNFGKRTKKVFIANPYGEDCVVYNKEDQDKIEFAIEKLEKVKHYAKHIQGGLIDYIDNQINELKEVK